MRAKDDCERLLNATLLFAKEMLRDHGEFLPFGAQIIAGGEIVAVAVDNEEAQLQSPDLVDLLQDVFKTAADQGNLIATALVYGVRVIVPGTDRKSDAIALNLDHRDSYSVKVFFPYVLADGEAALGAAFASDGDYAVFPSPNPMYA